MCVTSSLPHANFRAEAATSTISPLVVVFSFHLLTVSPMENIKSNPL